MYVHKKEDYTRDNICKSHSAKSEREPFRVCPSKLSKRELEDLYYSVVEANVNLKRTINSQEETIKTLSTKVKRMTVTPKSGTGRENDCCANIKAMVNEQKQSLADLKKQNERLSEKIRVLNMRLCSAKQFLRKSPATSMSRSMKCSAPPTSLKNSSVSIIQAQANDINPKSASVSSQYLVKNSSVSIIQAQANDINPKSAIVSSQYLVKDAGLSTRSVETETGEQEKDNNGKLCDENKCRSMIEELKQKIVNLQEELSNSHKEYSTRISRLEEEVSGLRVAQQRSAAARAHSAAQLQQRDDQASQLAARLRAAEAQYGELAMELSIEKRKVSELETRVKSVDMSCAVAKAIEEHLSNANQINNEIEKENRQLDTSSSLFFSPRDKSSPRIMEPSETRGLPSDATDQRDENKVSKLSDDSGLVADSSVAEDDKAQKILYEEIHGRILILQEQLDILKQSAKRPEPKEVKSVPSKSLCFTPRLPPARGADLAGAAAQLQPESYVSVTQEKVEPKENKLNTSAFKVKNTPQQSQDSKLNTLSQLDHDSSGFVKEAKEAFIKVKSVERHRLNSELKVIPVPEMGRPTPEKATLPKSDSHNSMQIPGPLPVGQYNAGSPVKTNDRKRKKVKSMERDSTDSTMSHAKEVISLDITDYNDLNESMDPNLQGCNKPFVTKENERNVRKSTLLGESSLHLTLGTLHSDMAPGPSRPEKDIGVQGNKALEADNFESVKDSELLVKVAGPSLTEKSVEDEMSYYVPPNQIMISDSREMFATDAKPASPVRPNVDTKEPIDTQTYSELSPAQESPRQRSATYSKDASPKTYSVPPRSPDNTDFEISTLTDLPSEKDGKSPRILSPGEKPTSTYTESYSAPTTTDYGALSEGELPGAGGGRKLSVGEAKVNFQYPGITTQRMEEALTAISEELALCRDLLQAKQVQVTQLKP